MIRPPPAFPAAREREYLAHFTSGDGERLVIGAYATLVLCTLLFWSDYLLLGNSPLLVWLLLLRVVLIGICLRIAFQLRAGGVSPERLLFFARVFSISFVIAYGLILVTRPAHYYGHIVFDVATALIAPFVLPERLSIRLFLPLAISAVSLLTVLGLRDPMADVIRLVVVLTFVIVVLAGYLLGNLAYGYRRHAWLRERELTSLLIQRESWLAAKRQLLRTVSHELRTPLNVISSSLSLLGDYGGQLADAQRTDVADRLREAVRRMNDMVEKAMIFSCADKEDEGASFPDYFFTPRKIDLVRWMEGLVDDLRLSILLGRTVELNPMDVPSPLVLPAQALRVICENLLGNAAKYSPQEQPIVISARMWTGQLELRVRDYGDGFSDDEKRHVFVPFFRGAAARRQPDIPGSGLGLAIVREVVAALEGTVGIERPAGGGACLVVRLPLGIPA